MLFKKKFLVVFFISAFSLSCTFEPLYSEKFLLEYEIIEPSKSNKDLHEIYRNLKNLASINENDRASFKMIALLHLQSTIIHRFLEGVIYL